MTQVLAIDPGTLQSGYVVYDGRVWEAGVVDNDELLAKVKAAKSDLLAIENIVSYGNIVGSETFQTCRWIGRFQQAWPCPDEVRLVTRAEVKKSLGLRGSAKDKDVNAALLRFIGSKGTKSQPGPTYGVKSHAWAALGVAYAAAQMLAREAA